MKILERSLILGLLGWVSGCGAQSDGGGVGSGGNTNWLAACQSSSSCGDGICASGACTPTCERSSDCSGLGDNAACGGSVTVIVSGDACEQGQMQQVCAPTCDDDGDCDDIGSGYRCESNVCVPGSCVTEPPYEPCANQACGETCRECAPDDDDCNESEEVKYCDNAGVCSGTQPECDVVSPEASTCSTSSIATCEDAPGCKLVLGSPAVDCRLQAPQGIGCIDLVNASSPSADTCVIAASDGLCYYNPTDEASAFAEVVSCDDDARCVLLANGCNAEECFSPSQHAEDAYSDTRLGCACDDVGSACVGSAALMCNDGQWRAVEDGPCYPTTDECEARLDDVTTCLELFDTCRQEPDGSFCGFGHRTFDCRYGQVVQSSAGCLQDDSYCFELPNGGWCTGPADPECPDGYSPGAECAPKSTVDCFQYTSVLHCRLDVITRDECTALNAEPIDFWAYDVQNRGCPDDGTALAWLDWGEEGGLCCGSADASDGGTNE